QLIGDTKQRPERFNAALRITHALDQKESPTANDQETGQDIRLRALDVAERLANVAQRVLEQIASHTRARIQRGENKQRFEHNGEVIPEIEPPAADGGRKNVRHPYRQSCGAAGSIN